MTNFLNNYIKKNFVFIFALIFLVFITNFSLNFFLITKYNYENRLIKNYGYCGKGGYGFIKSIKNNYKINKNLYVENFNDFSSIQSLFYNFNDPVSESYLVIIGASEEKIIEYLKGYQIIEHFNNCYFLKKND